jgi:anti-sigma B factor antagonist
MPSAASDVRRSVRARPARLVDDHVLRAGAIASASIGGLDAATGTPSRAERVVLQAVGEVDVHTAASLRAHLAGLIDSGVDDIVVDLTDVTFLDSTGAGVLAGALKAVQGRGGRLQLVIASEGVLRLFRIAALMQVFTIHRHLNDALAH